MDGSAINRVARESNNYNATFAALTPLVIAGELTFCDEVVVELQRTAEGDPGSLWADTVKGHRANSTASYTTQRWVMHNVERVLDPDDRYDAAPFVIAQARGLHNDGAVHLALVTEDVAEKPTRRAVSDVCDELGLRWMRVPDMMAACNVAWP